MPVQIGNITYTAKDLENANCVFGKVKSGWLENFFKSATKLWKFNDKSLFLARLVTLHEKGWVDGMAVPDTAVSQFKSPGEAEMAGTVLIGLGLGKGSATLKSSDGLLNHELFRIFTLTSERLGRLSMLASESTAARWSFPGWDELMKLLDFWDEQKTPPQEWNLTTSVTQQLLSYRQPMSAQSVKDRYDPDTKVGCNKVGLQNIWMNCGSAATHLIGRIADLGGMVEKSYYRRFCGEEQAKFLVEALMAPVAEPTLIHISNPVLHEFTIEKHSNGSALLQQGYQSAYSALWWAGFTGLDSAEFTLKAAAAAKMEADRREFGAGAPIDLAALAERLAAFLDAPEIRHDKAQLAWRKLPFQSRDNTNESAVPEWQVTKWTVRKPGIVLSALSAKNCRVDPPWLSMAVLEEAAQVWKNAS